uniref:Ribosomal protein L11 n=1 Tax=Histiona aroides TaxID=392300 RepID=M4QCW3_HISAR|nr:ribosomal protein L11 [Histiona aroides]AGH24035.1 ribosomal protein L11 [Histiona aroides]
MKKITGYIRLEIEAGKASPSPPVGPALGLRGLNIMQFCKDFNNQCSVLGIKEGPVPTLITVYEDRTYTYKIKTPAVSHLMKAHLNIKKGQSKAGKEQPISIDLRSLYEIARIKQEGTRQNIQSVCRSVHGTAKSMGIKASDYKTR